MKCAAQAARSCCHPSAVCSATAQPSRPSRASEAVTEPLPPSWRRGATGYKGVTALPTGFRARLRGDGETLSLGSFATAEEAARVVDA